MAYYLVPQQPGRTIVLDKAIVFVGRHPDCDVILTDSRKVSRKHCCIAQVNDRYLIRDLGSMNGVRVNGCRIEREVDLTPGDEVVIGDVCYLFQMRSGTSPPRPADRKRPPAVRGPIIPPSVPLDLSQELPVPIPDQDDDFEVLSNNGMPLESDSYQEHESHV